MDLGVCIEGIRRAIVYGKGILEYKKHPRKVRRDYARISTEGFLEAMKAIAENCLLPEYKKESLLEKYRRLKESPWQTIAEFGLTEAEITSVPDEALMFLRDYVGFDYEKYEKYVPR